eukprot:366016-Chlamydomonas_euryale.AAC.1
MVRRSGARVAQTGEPSSQAAAAAAATAARAASTAVKPASPSPPSSESSPLLPPSRSAVSLGGVADSAAAATPPATLLPAPPAAGFPRVPPWLASTGGGQGEICIPRPAVGSDSSACSFWDSLQGDVHRCSVSNKQLPRFSLPLRQQLVG